MLKSTICLIIVVLYIGSSFAEEKNSLPEKYLVIKPFINSKVSTLEEDQINKSMLRIVTRQHEFELMLSSLNNFSGIKTNIYSVEVKIKINKDSYNIKSILRNMKSNREIKAVKFDNVLKKDLLRKVTVSLELLFFDERNDKETRKNNSTVPVKGDKNNVKPDRGLKAFKNRINGLRKALAKNFNQIEKELSDSGDTKENEDDSDPDENKDDKKNKEQNMAELDKKNKKRKKNKKKKSVSGSYGGHSEFWVGYLGHAVNSKEDIEDSDVQLETETTIPYLGFAYYKGINLDKKKRFASALGLQYAQTYATFDQAIGKYLVLRLGITANIKKKS